MITVDNAGGALSSTYTDRLAENFIPPDEGPIWKVLFCREDPTTYTCREVTELWINQNPFGIGLGEDFGLSSGGSIEFIFDNSPITRLSANYSSGTTLTVVPVNHRFTLAADDWISVSDGQTTEFKRIISVTVTQGAITAIVINSALSNSYLLTETEIRYVWAIDAAASAINGAEQDEFRGILKIILDFQDISEEMCLFQGNIQGGRIGDDNTLLIRCEPRTQELVRTRLEFDFEVDDRGVVSPGAPDPTNTGDGYMESPQYLAGKLPDDILTQTWTFTFDSTLVDGSGNVSGGWDIVGSSVGTVVAPIELPHNVEHGGWMPTGEAGHKRWAIDLTSHLGGVGYGFAVNIIEGDTAFATSDAFKVFSQASGTVTMVKGADFAATPLDIVSLTALEPSRIVEEFVDNVVSLQHTNPETSVLGSMFNSTNLANFRADAADSRLLRGRFKAGTSAIEVINQTLRAANGWIYPSNDDHFLILPYNFITATATSVMNIIADADNSGGVGVYNVVRIELRNFDLEWIKNRLVIDFDLEEDKREDIRDNTPSITEFGRIEDRIFTEDFREAQYTIQYNISAADRAFFAADFNQRFNDRKAIATVTMGPEAIRLEPGDLVTLETKRGSFSETFFVQNISKNFRTLESIVILEEEIET